MARVARWPTSFIHITAMSAGVTVDPELTLAPGGQARGRRRRSVMPGAVLLDRRARQRTSSSMAGPRASGRHPERTVDRHGSLTSLKRAMIAARQDLLRVGR